MLCVSFRQAGFLTAVLVSFAGSCLLVVLSSARLVTDNNGGGGDGVTASVYEVVDKVGVMRLPQL